jgi:hypothetical protein
MPPDTVIMKKVLTDTEVKNAKPTPDGKPKKHTDGGGLYLLVSIVGKYWRYDYRFFDKRKTLAIGVYPDVSLKEARNRHEAARELLEKGVDPSRQAIANYSGNMITKAELELSSIVMLRPGALIQVE